MRIFVALAVAATSLVVPAAPAQAYEPPVRIVAHSGFDPFVSKSARAECPLGQVVFGMGGRINDGFGGVALTGIMPDRALSSVTVWGHELPGHTGSWSVTAVAVCHAAREYAPQRVSSAPDQYLATAACPPSKILYSMGYQIPLANGDEYIREVIPTYDLTEFTVRADGTGVDPLNLVAYGVCAYPLPRYELTRAQTAFDATSPKEAQAPQAEIIFHDYGSWMFGAGALVEGASGVLLDTLLPASGLDVAKVRAYRASTGGAVAALGEQDWELVAYGTYIGDYY